MGLYVSTTGTDVSIPELGFTLVHPSTDYALSDQFSPEDLQRAASLTDAIRGGTLLTWKKTAGGSAETATDYDPDYVEADEMNTGVGAQADRLVSFKDLTASTLETKAGYKASTDFSGTPHKKATVTFDTAFPAGTAYSITLSGVDVRFWTLETISVTGFVINSNANQSLTGSVYWTATVHGETV